MAKKSLPKNPLAGGVLVKVSGASAELVRFQDHMKKASAFTVEVFGTISRIIAGVNTEHGLSEVEIPQPILDIQKDIISQVTDPARLEMALEQVLPQILSEIEQKIITNENSRGDLPSETTAARALCFQSFRELLAVVLASVRREKALKALAAVMDSLESLKENPVIQDSPWVSDFVTRLAADVGRSNEPHDVIASIAKTNGATKAATIRHAPSVEIQIRVVKEWDRLKSEGQYLTKNKAAEDIALDAVDWNVELGGKIKSLTTYGTAVPAVRKWLQNGNMEKIRVLMRA